MNDTTSDAKHRQANRTLVPARVECSVRPARVDDAARLTELALRSKQSNGYDQAFMEACRNELTVTARKIEEKHYLVAEASREQTARSVCGFVCLDYTLDNTHAEIQALFVDPAWQRCGVGRKLWQTACGQIQNRNITHVSLDADPAAVPFYEALGFQKTLQVPSGSIAGRFLPRMEASVPALKTTRVCIESYRPEYGLETIKLIRESFRQAMTLSFPDSLDDVLGHLDFLSSYPKESIHVAIDVRTSDIVGCLVLNNEDIEQLYVRVGWQRKGIGSRFMRLAKQQFPKRLAAHTFKRNVQSPPFYIKHGFVAKAHGRAARKDNPWASHDEQLDDIQFVWEPR